MEEIVKKIAESLHRFDNETLRVAIKEDMRLPDFWQLEDEMKLPYVNKAKEIIKIIYEKKFLLSPEEFGTLFLMGLAVYGNETFKSQMTPNMLLIFEEIGKKHQSIVKTLVEKNFDFYDKHLKKEKESD